jgi:hypothetical protein
MSINNDRRWSLDITGRRRRRRRRRRRMVRYFTNQLVFQHDSTVAAVADAMSVYNQLAPPYATALIVELHFNYPSTQGYCVKIRFRNESNHDPYVLQHPGMCLVDSKNKQNNNDDENVGVFAIYSTLGYLCSEQN